MKGNLLFILAVLAAVILISTFVIGLIDQAQDRARAECAMKGGTLVFTKSGSICFDSSVIKS